VIAGEEVVLHVAAIPEPVRDPGLSPPVDLPDSQGTIASNQSREQPAGFGREQLSTVVRHPDDSDEVPDTYPRMGGGDVTTGALGGVFP